MHARLDHGDLGLLTRNGLNWTGKYPQIAAAVSSLPGARQAYVDGELCGVRWRGRGVDCNRWRSTRCRQTTGSRSASGSPSRRPAVPPEGFDS